MAIAEANAELVRLGLLYLVPFAVAVMVYWVTCGWGTRKRLVSSVLSFVVLLSIFSFVREEIVSIVLLVYLVPFGLSVLVYTSTEELEQKKRTILAVGVFIIVLSLSYILFR